MPDQAEWQERINALIDDSKWNGGWYQPIAYPNGCKTRSTKYTPLDFYSRDSFGINKWNRVIEPHLPIDLVGKSFLEIGSNAALFLVMASLRGASRVLGVEPDPHFYAHGRLTIDLFADCGIIGYNAPATIQKDALAYVQEDMADAEPVDITLLANALYWLTFSDEDGYIPDHEQAMHDILSGIAKRSRWLMTIGEEGIGRVGGRLDLTLPQVRKHFDITTEKVVVGNDRVLNVIVGRSLTCK